MYQHIAGSEHAKKCHCLPACTWTVNGLLHIHVMFVLLFGISIKLKDVEGVS